MTRRYVAEDERRCEAAVPIAAKPALGYRRCKKQGWFAVRGRRLCRQHRDVLLRTNEVKTFTPPEAS